MYQKRSFLEQAKKLVLREWVAATRTVALADRQSYDAQDHEAGGHQATPQASFGQQMPSHERPEEDAYLPGRSNMTHRGEH